MVRVRLLRFIVRSKFSVSGRGRDKIKTQNTVGSRLFKC
jgi:hypothetical protein